MSTIIEVQPTPGGGSVSITEANIPAGGTTGQVLSKLSASDYAVGWQDVSIGSVAWADITGKPSTFTPSAHSHVIGDVTGLQAALDGKQVAGSYEAAGTSATGIAAHEAALNPHAQYLTETEADALYAPIGAAGGLNQGVATIDFGAFPGSNEASVSFANAAIGAFVVPFFASDDTTADHTANDHKYAAMLVQLSAQTTPGVGGVIHARSEHKMQGTFDVHYGY